MSTDREPDRRLLRDVAALADGSLAAARRARVEAAIRADPALAAILAGHRRALAAVDAPGVAAPAALRARVEAMQAERGAAGRGARWRRLRADERAGTEGVRSPGLGGALAAPHRRRALTLAFAALAVLLALVLALPGGTPGAPSVVEAAVLTARPATATAPAIDVAEPALLERRVGGVAFPNWGPSFGWRAVGQRVDRLDGRATVTVIYARGAQRLGYTILAGAPLRWPRGAARTLRNDTDVRGLSVSGRETVTWRRGGHSCVMSGERGVSRAELVRLASWRDGGSLVY